jgi:PKD repeat protein
VQGGLAPLTVTVTNTSTGITSVDWWRWSFGSTRVETTLSTPVSYTFTDPGSYAVSLRANLSGGGNSAITSNGFVNVSGLAFTNRTVTTGAAPLTVTFTNQSFGMANMNWNFGDGGSTATSSLTTSYTYTNAGTYTVTLYGDFNGTTYSVARTNLVVVSPAPVASFYASVTAGSVTNVFVVGTTTNRGFNVPFINTSSNATAYAWTFGDGRTSTNKYPSNIYTNAGTYTVTLKAIKLGVTNTLTRTNYIIVNP